MFPRRGRRPPRGHRSRLGTEHALIFTLVATEAVILMSQIGGGLHGLLAVGP